MKRLTLLSVSIVLLTNLIYSQSVEIKDNADETLLIVNDEGTNESSLTIPNSPSAPTVTDNKLYNEGGALKWGGNIYVTNNITIQDFLNLKHSSYLLNDADTITPTSSYIFVEPSGSSHVMLNGTTAIADVTTIGQLLIIEGSSTYQVRIPHNANTKLNLTSLRYLANDSILILIWNGNDWMEISYSANWM